MIEDLEKIKNQLISLKEKSLENAFKELAKLKGKDKEFFKNILDNIEGANLEETIKKITDYASRTDSK